MTPIQQLDEVLKYLAGAKGNSTQEDILKGVNKISKHEYAGDELARILMQLVIFNFVL